MTLFIILSASDVISHWGEWLFLQASSAPLYRQWKISHQFQLHRKFGPPHTTKSIFISCCPCMTHLAPYFIVFRLFCNRDFFFLFYFLFNWQYEKIFRYILSHCIALLSYFTSFSLSHDVFNVFCINKVKPNQFIPASFSAPSTNPEPPCFEETVLNTAAPYLLISFIKRFPFCRGLESLYLYLILKKHIYLYESTLSGLDLVSPTFLVSVNDTVHKWLESLLMWLDSGQIPFMLKDIWQMNVCGETVGHLFLFQWQNLTLKLQASSRWQNIFIPWQLAKLHLLCLET